MTLEKFMKKKKDSLSMKNNLLLKTKSKFIDKKYRKISLSKEEGTVMGKLMTNLLLITISMFTMTYLMLEELTTLQVSNIQDNQSSSWERVLHVGSVHLTVHRSWSTNNVI